MIRSPFVNFGFYGTLFVMGLGAFALLPGDETARPAVERIATVEPDSGRPSYIVDGAPAPIPRPARVATIDTVETASVATTTPAPAEQPMPAPLGSEPKPVETASLTVTTPPPADSSEFPMDVAAPETEAVLPPNARRLNVTSAVNMRAGPSTSTSTIKVLPEGEPVAVLGRNRGWVNVMLPDGQSGWVYERYLSDGSRPVVEQRDEERTASVEPRRERVVDEDEEESRFAVRRQARAVEDDEDDRRGYFVRRTVELRDRPSRSGMPLFRIRRGEPVEIAEQRGSWVRIRVDGGISGWVQTRYIAD